MQKTHMTKTSLKKNEVGRLTLPDTRLILKLQQSLLLHKDKHVDQ